MGLADIEQHSIGARHLSGSDGETEVGGVFHAVKQPDATTGADILEGLALGSTGQRQSDLGPVGRHAPQVVG